MSFLSGGAECSTGRNPLSQFTKHVSDDKSLQRDRMVGQRPGGGMQGMRTQQMMGQNVAGDQQVIASHIDLECFFFLKAKS